MTSPRPRTAPWPPTSTPALRRLAAALLAVAASAWPVATAEASSLPDASVQPGHVAITAGAVGGSLTVGVADGMTVGGLAWLTVTGPATGAFVTQRLAQGAAGTLSLMAFAGSGATFVGNASGGNMGLLGLAVETPRRWYVLRACLLPGLLAANGAQYDDAGAVRVADVTTYHLALYPALEIAFPFGEHFELSIGGTQLMGYTIRF